MNAEETVRRFVDACWNVGDETSVRALCEEGLADRMLRWADRVRAGGPDLVVTIDVLTTSPDGWVGTLQTREQTHTGALTGPIVEELTPDGQIAPTGQRLRTTSAVFYRVSGARIVDLVNIADNLRFFSHFGRMRLERVADGTPSSTRT